MQLDRIRPDIVFFSCTILWFLLDPKLDMNTTRCKYDLDCVKGPKTNIGHIYFEYECGCKYLIRFYTQTRQIIREISYYKIIDGKMVILCNFLIYEQLAKHRVNIGAHFEETTLKTIPTTIMHHHLECGNIFIFIREMNCFLWNLCEISIFQVGPKQHD